jgi:hypothetical protein
MTCFRDFWDPNFSNKISIKKDPKWYTPEKF